MAKLRVALSGAGMITEFHLKAWAAIPDAEVVAIADPDQARAAARAAAFGIPQHYPTLHAMLNATPGLGALDVASPREVHAEQVLAAAARGIPVLCQKPLAPTLAEAEALVRALDGRVRLMVHENWRFRPYYRQIAAWMAEGHLGQLTNCTLLVHNSGLVRDAQGEYPALKRQPFFATERRLLVAETLIHHLDAVRWLVGPLRMIAANLRRTSDQVVGESAATLLMQNAQGVPVLVDGNLTCAGLPAATKDRLLLAGTQASILLENDRLHLLGPDPAEIAYVHDEAYQSCFTETIRHFVDGLRTGAPFETAPEDNLETLRLVEDSYRLSGFTPSPA